MFSAAIADARKRNPYVGYMGVPEGRRPQFYLPGNHMRSSPYVGMFRHAPPAFSERRPYVSTQKHVVIQITAPQGKLAMVDLHGDNIQHEMPLIDGKLLGGASENDIRSADLSSSYQSAVQLSSFPPMTWLDEKFSDSVSFSRTPRAPQAHLCRSLVPAYRSLQRLQSNLANNSALITLLTLRLPNIFRRLLLLQSEDSVGGLVTGLVEKQSPPASEDEDSSDDTSHCSTHSSESIDYDYPLKRSSPSVDDGSQSPGVALLLDLLDSSENHGATHRLDYVITQTDITRMARNASRHLDVASILSLPTVTYRSPPPKTVTIQKVEEDVQKHDTCCTDDDPTKQINEIGWSWLMVSQSEESEALAERVEADDDTTTASKVQDDDHEPSCVICLENFQDGDKLRVLPCEHLFHTGCIDHWLLGTYSDDDCVTSGCPMCKKHATASEEELSPISPDGTVPSWAFARLGDALAKESEELVAEQIVRAEDISLPSSVSSSS